MEKDLKDLSSSGVRDFPQSCKERMKKYHEHLDYCKEVSEILWKENVVNKFIHVHGHASKLQNIEKSLESAKGDLHFILSRVILQETLNTKRDVAQNAKKVVEDVTIAVEASESILNSEFIVVEVQIIFPFHFRLPNL